MILIIVAYNTCMIITFCQKKSLLGDIDDTLVLYWGWGAPKELVAPKMVAQGHRHVIGERPPGSRLPQPEVTSLKIRGGL
jgi:hypothetical protein